MAVDATRVEGTGSGSELQFFTPLTEANVYQALHDCDRTDRAAAYGEWLDSYARRSTVFHASQFKRHQTWTLQTFYAAHQLDLDTDLAEYGEGYLYAWETFKIETGLAEHRRTVDEIGYALHCMLEKRYPVYSWIEQLAGTRPHVGSLIERIWNRWFMTRTRTGGPAEQEALRRMPYDRYLMTTYWRRVRGAMLLCRGLRCEGEPCVASDSYFMSEADLHIHHLHYQNRGNEQLANLRLVCAHCHDMVHSGRGDAVFPVEKA